MPDEDSGVFVLTKKAFVATVVAIALNPIGIAVGYGVGKWLQAPKLSVPTLTVDAQTAGITLPKELVGTLEIMERYNVTTSYRYAPEEQDKLRKGELNATAVRGLTSELESYVGNITNLKKDLEDNIAVTSKWNRGEELIVRPIFLATGRVPDEAPQSIVTRGKSELLGIYRSTLKDVQSKSEDVEKLLAYLKAHPPSETRTGEAVIRVGVLNSGDSEGVIYPRAVLRSTSVEIDLAPTSSDIPVQGSTGGYVVVPARSFRELTFTMDRSTRGDAAENWKKLVQNGRGNDVTVVLQTSGGDLPAKGNLPL